MAARADEGGDRPSDGAGGAGEVGHVLSGARLGAADEVSGPGEEQRTDDETLVVQP